jgi:hypothetical protein
MPQLSRVQGGGALSLTRKADARRLKMTKEGKTMNRQETLAAESGFDRPLLASPPQIEAERLLLAMLDDPGVKRIQTELRAELLARPRGRIPSAISSIDESIAQWTNSLILSEIQNVDPQTNSLWTTDDTPRTWFGYTLPGVGTSGDNPDAIYRTVVLDSSGSYEMVGQFPRERRAAQIIVQVSPADRARPSLVLTPTANPDNKSFSHPVLLTDGDLPVQPDGSFRITFGPNPGGPHHYCLPQGPITLSTRDMLSDWQQRPCTYSVRRLDRDTVGVLSEARLRERIHEDLAGYVRFWSKFPDVWLKGLQPNQISGVVGRVGGWGVQVGLCYDLADEEAIIVRVGPSDAAYTGFQVMNPWMIAASALRHQCSLNLSQARNSTNGSITYVIANRDPGVANWLDTAGWPQGFGLLRWQALPAGSPTDGLIQEFRVTTLAEVAAMQGLPRVTSKERGALLAERETGYTSRTR